MATQKFYVVWVGRKPGVYDNWPEAKAQIDGLENARYKSYPSLPEAAEAFKKQPGSFKKAGATANHGGSKPILDSLAVDAACSGNPGVMEYRGVWTKTKQEVFHQGPFPEGTNNIGEFLALVHGLALLKKQNIKMPLYTDSMTALAWIRNKKAKTTLSLSPKNRELMEMVARAEAWLKSNSYDTEIYKWDTEHWGEIPADFGRK
jgi:ribonuclease HI